MKKRKKKIRAKKSKKIIVKSKFSPAKRSTKKKLSAAKAIHKKTALKKLNKKKPLKNTHRKHVKKIHSEKTAHKKIKHKSHLKKLAKKIHKKQVHEKLTQKQFGLFKRTPINPAKVERLPTGIAAFDSLIEGGFEKNSTNLLIGGSGSGKTIFAAQFLIGGLRKGEKCLYVTFEEKKTQFYTHMKRFGWDLEEYEKKGLFTFLEYTPIKVKTMLEEGGGTVESIIIQNKVSRMVIDSITSFALLFDNELEKREAALALFKMIGKWDCTSLLTAEGKPFSDDEARTLEFESDGTILLHFIRKGKERERFLEILKMRGTNHSKKVYKIEITNTGIVIGQAISPPRLLRSS